VAHAAAWGGESQNVHTYVGGNNGAAILYRNPKCRTTKCRKNIQTVKFI
jgi:hypothetical protein